MQIRLIRQLAIAIVSVVLALGHAVSPVLAVQRTQGTQRSGSAVQPVARVDYGYDALTPGSFRSQTRLAGTPASGDNVGSAPVERVCPPRCQYDAHVRVTTNRQLIATKSVGALSDASDAAFKAADDIDNFTVGNKHLPGAGGKWNKFRAGVDPKSIIEEALRSPNAKFLPDATPGRFKIVVDMGTQVGEKAGQTAVRVVVTNEGKIITAFPVNP